MADTEPICLRTPEASRYLKHYGNPLWKKDARERALGLHSCATATSLFAIG